MPVKYGSVRETRPEQQLGQRRRTTDDVAADVVRVVGRHLGRRAHRRADDPLPEAGGESFDLRGDRLRSIARVAVRHVRVGPQRVDVARPTASGRRGTAGRRARTVARASFPRCTAFSLATISSAPPPRWTVPASRADAAVQGTSPIDGEVDLERCRGRGGSGGRSERPGSGSRSPRMSAAIDGDTSSISTSLRREVGRPNVTRTPVSIVPPWRSMSATNASAIDCEPPLRHHPALGVAGGDQHRARRRSSSAGRGGRTRARRCRPRAPWPASVLHVRLTAVAGSSAPAPKRANVNGWRGTRSDRLRGVGEQVVEVRRSAGSNTRRQR